MGMMKSKFSWLWVIALVIAWVSLIAFVGCKGQTTAPFGSSITVTGPFVISNITTTQTIKKEKYTIMVLDSGGKPMSGIDVQLSGIFTYGDQISLNGSPPQSAPTQINTTLTMGDGGFKDLIISAPSLSIRALTSPAPLTASAVTSGGTLTVGTFSYEVVATGALGATSVSNLASTTTTTTGSSVVLSWPAVNGSSGYNVYGDHGNGTWAALATGLTGTTMFTDIGVIGTSATQPTAGSSTPGAALNPLTGSIYAVSGSVSSIINVNF